MKISNAIPDILGFQFIQLYFFKSLVIGISLFILFVPSFAQAQTWVEDSFEDFADGTFDASHVAIGNLDNDSYPDLVLCYFSLQRAAGGEMMGGSSDLDKYTYILWGNVEGFSSSELTKFEAQYNIASAITDSDGHQDLIVAIHHGEKVYATESAVFFGKGNRQFEKSQNGIPSEGACHIAVAPPDGKFPQRVIISNSRGGNLREEVPLLLYWGSKDGFDPDRRTEIPFRSGYEATAADFNADGFVDLVAIDELHGGQSVESDEFAGANIYWGSENGFKQWNAQRLPGITPLAPVIADFDGDGLLDLVATNHSVDGNHNKAVSKVYYNDGNRFINPQGIEYLPLPGAHWMWNKDMGHIYDRSYRSIMNHQFINGENILMDGGMHA